MVGRIQRSRGISPAIGFILLIGIVATASLGLLTVGMDSFNAIEDHTRTERVEQGFVELKHTMTTATRQPASTRSIDLDIGKRGAVIKEDTGQITIRYTNPDEEIHEPLTFGTVEYHGKDGSIIAHEAGAVFKGKGDDAQMVSTPDIHYHNESNTLTFPVMEIIGTDELQSGDMTVQSHNSSGYSDVVENKEVIITIESEYWRAWEDYFVDEVGHRGVIAKPYEKNESGSVRVNLGRISEETPFENAVYAEEEVSLGGDSEVIGNQTIGDPLEPINETIAQQIDTAKAEYQDEGTITGGEYESGKYYADEVDLEDDLVFDLSEGDAELVVEDDISVTDEFRVANAGNHSLKISLGGDIDIQDQMCIDDSACSGTFSDRNGEGSPGPGNVTPGTLQIYGTSEFHLEMSTGHTYLEGVVYAPQGKGGDTSVDLSGNDYIDGSIVVGSVTGSGTMTIEHEEELKWLDPEIGGGNQPPKITYLNLAYHEMLVERS